MKGQDERELAGQYMINALIRDNDLWLEALEDLEHEELIMNKKNAGWLKKIECLMIQIEQDNGRGDKRSVLRKTLLLRGLLKRKLK